MNVIYNYFCGVCRYEAFTSSEAEECCSTICIKCGNIIKGLPLEGWDICADCEPSFLKDRNG